MIQRIVNLGWLMVLGAGLYGGYRYVESRVVTDLYRQRLKDVANEYEQLRQRYNQVVRKTAVTELVVADGRLSVVIRTAGGQLQRIETPFDPAREIYVDYVIKDSRLWVRRVFDDTTPPVDGIVIDPLLGDVDWHDPALRHGKAVYRSLGEGRWVVTVSGDGSLVLAPAAEPAEADLAPPPVIGQFQTIDQQVRQQAGRIGPGDVIGRLIGDKAPDAAPQP
jgi:hypothetical protein